MGFQLGAIDTSILIVYGLILVGMGVYFFRKTKTSEQFMVAGRGIPAWAAGLAVMSAYTSSISYIACSHSGYVVCYKICSPILSKKEDYLGLWIP